MTGGGCKCYNLFDKRKEEERARDDGESEQCREGETDAGEAEARVQDESEGHSGVVQDYAADGDVVDDGEAYGER